MVYVFLIFSYTLTYSYCFRCRYFELDNNYLPMYTSHVFVHLCSNKIYILNFEKKKKKMSTQRILTDHRNFILSRNRRTNTVILFFNFFGCLAINCRSVLIRGVIRVEIRPKFSSRFWFKNFQFWKYIFSILTSKNLIFNCSDFYSEPNHRNYI